MANTMRESNVRVGLKSFVDYAVIKPAIVFLNLFFRHKGLFDGVHGFLFSLFSALHYPVAYGKFAWGILK